MKNRVLSRWIDDFLKTHPARANSLIITLYGDLIAPHGGTIWLGSVIRLVDVLGLNERVVRTSVYRLSQEKWLSSHQIGRKSYYSLTASGLRRFENAYRRIYHEPQSHWTGEWQIALLPATMETSRRDTIRKELLWAGYGAFAPTVLAHPSSDADSLASLLEQTGTQDEVVAMRATGVGALSSRPLQALVHECWNLEAIARRYDELVARLRPVLKALRSAKALDPEQCFLVQILMMHDYRRTLLHDPQLPTPLLPRNWSGGVARQMCRDIYRLTCPLAQQHLLAAGETPDGPMPAASPYFYQRFGGFGETNDGGDAAAAG